MTYFKFSFISAIAIATLIITACAGDMQDIPNSSDINTACLASGGIYKDGRCVCDGQICDSGAVCNLDSKECLGTLPKICKEGQNICSSGKIYICDKQEWKEGEACGLGLCTADLKACAECTADLCEDAHYSKCVGNRYLDPIVCTEGCNTQNTACKPECSGTEQTCKDGMLKTCVNGAYDAGTQCEDDKGNATSCKDETTCGVCLDDAKICEDGMLKTCVSGAYDAGKQCKDDKDNATSCKDETACRVCVDDATVCEDGVLKTCIDGVYDAGKQCVDDKGNATSCKDETTCKVCVDDAKICEDGKLKTCIDGVYDAGIACMASDQAVSCKDGKTCGDCLDGTSKCENRPEKISEREMEIGYQFSCTNGVWQDTNATMCTPRSSCSTNALACGKCINNAVQCGTTEGDLDYVYTCVEGAYVKAKTQCSLKCENGLCVNE